MEPGKGAAAPGPGPGPQTTAAPAEELPVPAQGARSRLWTALRVLIAALLVFALLYTDAIDVAYLGSVLSRPATSLPCLAMLLAAFVLGGVRWYMILRAFRVPLGFRPTFEVYGIGAFLNTFLPGGTGGDAVRVIYGMRLVKQGRLACAMSVVADRLSGLYGMLAVSMLLIGLNSATVMAHPVSQVIALSLALAFASFTLGAVAWIVFSARLSRWAAARVEGRQGRVASLVRRAVSFDELVRHALPSLFLSVLVSGMVSVLLVASTVVAARGLAGAALGALDYATAGVFALLASALPITPGGIGIAEGAYNYICVLWAGPGTGIAFGTIFLGYRVLSMAVNALGAIAFATHARP